MLPPETQTSAARPNGPSLRAPRAAALLGWLGNRGASRYRFRFLQSLALSLAINQCVMLWLGHFAGTHTAGRVKLFASTAYWSVGITLVAGWLLLGGWFDNSTRTLFEQLASRRGYGVADCRRLETMASWRWLARVIAFPCLVLGIAGTSRISTIREFGAWMLNLVLCLAASQLTVACTVLCVTGLGRFELNQARRLWLLVCFAPEMIRPILPGFPTVRTLATGFEQLILRWGASG